MPTITPSLRFDNNLVEAAEFYTSVFPNSSPRSSSTASASSASTAARCSRSEAVSFEVLCAGPIVTVLVIAGAGATAMCADLGARTIREELDALRVMGVNPIQTLVVPRVLAATLVSPAVVLVGLTGAFFCVYGRCLLPCSAGPGVQRVRSAHPAVRDRARQARAHREDVRER